MKRTLVVAATLAAVGLWATSSAWAGDRRDRDRDDHRDSKWGVRFSIGSGHSWYGDRDRDRHDRYDHGRYDRDRYDRGYHQRYYYQPQPWARYYYTPQPRTYYYYTPPTYYYYYQTPSYYYWGW